ncbi:hypothetical protein B0J18DRAFT_243855 [Chaetomium sp. MPI-SDFR-AT-0129]|nr:hypothetical protein B0J18DRAFT_243855 [Chaetomium sp. MPI-SDFR-AT-0129]
MRCHGTLLSFWRTSSCRGERRTDAILQVRLGRPLWAGLSPPCIGIHPRANSPQTLGAFPVFTCSRTLHSAPSVSGLFFFFSFFTPPPLAPRVLLSACFSLCGSTLTAISKHHFTVSFVVVVSHLTFSFRPSSVGSRLDPLVAPRPIDNSTSRSPNPFE